MTQTASETPMRHVTIPMADEWWCGSGGIDTRWIVGSGIHIAGKKRSRQRSSLSKTSLPAQVAPTLRLLAHAPGHTKVHARAAFRPVLHQRSKRACATTRLHGGRCICRPVGTAFTGSATGRTALGSSSVFSASGEAAVTTVAEAFWILRVLQASSNTSTGRGAGP